MLKPSIANQKGELGSIFITDTTLHTPPNGNQQWTVIECIADCTFTTLTDRTCVPTNCNQITLAAGRLTYGNFTAIQLATGRVKAYV